MAAEAIGPIGNLAQALASVAQNAATPAFNLSFSQMQNTLIGRLNKEIHAVNAAGGSKAELLSLQSKGKKFAQNLPLIEKFLFDTESNKGRLAGITTKLATLTGLFVNNTISAADLTTFNTTRQDIVNELNKLSALTYTGFTDGNSIQRLRNEVAGLSALAPVQGAVDAVGAPTTNVNRAVLTSLETLQNKTSTAQIVTANSIVTIVDMRQGMLSKMAGIQTNVTELNSTVQLKKLAEVEALKQKYANVLQSISLSYEVSKGLTQAFTDALSSQAPQTGSIVSLFG